MFELITSACNGIFIIFFVFVNCIILFYFLKKLRNTLSNERMTTGYVLVTGCDSGYGKAAAMEMSNQGLFVFAGCLSLEGVNRYHKDENFNGLAFIMDITKQEDVENARNIIEAKVGEDGLHCLLNNGGIFLPGPIEWMPEDDMKRSMEINLWGAVKTTKAMLPLIKKARGRIINIATMAGRVSFAHLSSYCMSKYALEAFSDSLRLEMKPWDVSVHIIETGLHGSNLFTGTEKRWRALWEIQSEAVQKEYGERFITDLLAIDNKYMANVSCDGDDVVKAYVHAALSSRPQKRYVLGMDANTLFTAISVLPTTMADYLYNLVFKNATPAAVRMTR